MAKEDAAKENEKESAKMKEEEKKDKSKDKSKKTNEENDAESESSNVPISIDPTEARFSNAGGKSEHMVVNFTPRRMALKIRCGNALFRVEPTHMIIEPNKCRQLTFTRMPGPIQKDKAFVQYIEIEKDAQDAKTAFKNAESAGTKIQHIKVQLVAGAEGGRKMSREVIEE